jgi:DHA1 family multidrug resistance protein-like MFS transporter
MTGVSARLAWRRNLFAVTAASFIGFTGFTLVMPFLPFFIRQLGVSDVGEIALWTGAILGVTPALTALMSPFWGRLADRYGRRIMVARSLVACAVAMGLMAFVTRPWHVFGLRAALGFFTGYGGLTLSMAAESAPRDRMAAAIGTVQTAQRLGPAVGPVVGGLLAGAVGLRGSFLVTAGLYTCALLLVLLVYEEQPLERGGSPDQAGRVSFRSVLAFENFLLLLGVVFGIQFVDRSIGPILPLYLEELGVTGPSAPVAAGLMFSATALTASLGHHFCGRLLTRFSARVVISAAAAGAGLATALIGVGGGFWWLMGSMGLFGYAIGTASTAAYTAAGAVIPAGSHGTGFGVLSSAGLTGLAVSPVVAGSLGATTLRAVFVLDVVVLAVLAAIVRRVMVEKAPVTAPVIEDA